jgi:hypothetical protein
MADNPLISVQKEVIEQALPAYVVVAQDTLKAETLVSTVSSKGPSGRWGNTCEKCYFVPDKGAGTDYVKIGKDENEKWYALHFPMRCKKCAARCRSWSRAKRAVMAIDMVRCIKGHRNLKLTTFTQDSWSIPNWSASNEQIKMIDDDKKKLLRRHRNYRLRDPYWKTRDASGIIYPELKITPMWNGWGWDEVNVNVHLHMIIASKYLDNKPVKDSRGDIVKDSMMFESWGNIVDVREVKCSYDQNDKYWNEEEDNSMIFWGLRNVLSYVTKYVNKMGHWRSSRFGDWGA